MNVGKATDGLLDKIGKLIHQRDEAIKWMSLMVEAGEMDEQMADSLSGLLKPTEEKVDG